MSAYHPTPALEVSTGRRQLRTFDEGAKTGDMSEPDKNPGQQQRHHRDRRRRTVPWLVASILLAVVAVSIILWRAVATSTDL